MLVPNEPALILAPMQGLTDAPMRAFQGESGAFTFAVSEFLRINSEVLSKKVIFRDVPELRHGGETPSGLPVQVQILGGDAERMAQSALVAYQCGARAIDVNFGCPAPTVNRHDGGATLLKHPARIREIIAAIRAALPLDIPVSAKLRLGWDNLEAIHENADMAAEGGASWIAIHGRTRVQGYRPPAYWNPIGMVRARLSIPVVANGDIWSLEDFERCRDETGCLHFMLGRGALANPHLPCQVAAALGLVPPPLHPETAFAAKTPAEWIPSLRRLVALTEVLEQKGTGAMASRLKQWLNLAHRHGDFAAFDAIKRAQTTEEIFETLTDFDTADKP